MKPGFYPGAEQSSTETGWRGKRRSPGPIGQAINGCVLAQCLAMSIRVASHTFSRLWT
jgi:hypothetical protein